MFVARDFFDSIVHYAKGVAQAALSVAVVVLDAGFWHWLDSTLALSGLFSLR
jgi:hypothetical protein